ncbi:thiamine phosphate synthase [Telmatospirillum siberiense]|uniref:Thiamine-phosphate synthase n=1 Tax=Telmatospirillum siberiense TaxID=382514 RepID=A0A2N3PWB8_9PROT|nr:thiamine phosphate synthase [Telmatospirillum siberiense]PKU24699.1 thiamine phosphate synthase [Telmatospirillum siberiense]
MTITPERLRLYLVTDDGLTVGRPLADIVLAAVAGGVTIVQLREKRATTRHFVEQARALKAALSASGVPLIINDRIDIALAVGADGVHLGDDDMPASEARRILGKRAIIGISLGGVPENAADAIAQADYVAASPVFATGTKPDAGPALGLDGVRALRRAVPRPLVAIGGINQGNARQIVEAGAHGIAVVSAIMAAADPEAAAARLKDAVEGALRQ